VFNKKAKGRKKLCGVVQCTLAIAEKGHILIVYSHRGLLFEEGALQACKGGF